MAKIQLTSLFSIAVAVVMSRILRQQP